MLPQYNKLDTGFVDKSSCCALTRFLAPLLPPQKCGICEKKKQKFVAGEKSRIICRLRKLTFFLRLISDLIRSVKRVLSRRLSLERSRIPSPVYRLLIFPHFRSPCRRSLVNLIKHRAIKACFRCRFFRAHLNL